MEREKKSKYEKKEKCNHLEEGSNVWQTLRYGRGGGVGNFREVAGGRIQS